MNDDDDDDVICIVMILGLGTHNPPLKFLYFHQNNSDSVLRFLLPHPLQNFLCFSFFLLRCKEIKS